MSRKNKSKRGRRGEGSDKTLSAEVAARQNAPSRRFTPIKVGLGLGVVAIVAAVLFGQVFRGSDNAAMEISAEDSAQTAVGLPPPTFNTPMPVNNVDPESGKPIIASSPTIQYKGYVIGFCCNQSTPYRNWASMSESQKDAIVRRFLR